MSEGVVVHASVTGLAALMLRARVEAGLTQRDLAERTRIAQPNISAYESGRRTPTVRTLLTLLAACDAGLTLAPAPGQ